MKYIYTLFDKKSLTYQKNLMVLNSDDEAKRVLYVSTKQVNELKMFGSDYELYKVGKFDSFNGKIEPDFQFIINIKENEIIFDKEYKNERT